MYSIKIHVCTCTVKPLVKHMHLYLLWEEIMPLTINKYNKYAPNNNHPVILSKHLYYNHGVRWWAIQFSIISAVHWLYGLHRWESPSLCCPRWENDNNNNNNNNDNEKVPTIFHNYFPIQISVLWNVVESLVNYCRAAVRHIRLTDEGQSMQLTVDSGLSWYNIIIHNFNPHDVQTGNFHKSAMSCSHLIHWSSVVWETAQTCSRGACWVQLHPLHTVLSAEIKPIQTTQWTCM